MDADSSPSPRGCTNSPCKSQGFLVRTENSASEMGARPRCVCVSVGVGIVPRSRKVRTKPLRGESPHDLWKDTSERHSACHFKRSSQYGAHISTVCFDMLKMEPRTRHTLGRCYTTETHPHPLTGGQILGKCSTAEPHPRSFHVDSRRADPG